MNMQIIPDDAIEILKASDIDSRIKAAREIVASLFNELRMLNPIEREHGKYLQVDIAMSGYDNANPPDMGVYYGSELIISRIESLDQIKVAIREYDPARIKAKKIESLRSELAALESEQQPALTA
jgi:hypothetical protein